MQVKKAGGKVYGAVLTAAEKKAMDLEIQRELAEYDRKHIAEIDATILWVLHEQFGFGAQRLRTYYDAFHDRIKELVSRYEMEDQAVCHRVREKTCSRLVRLQAARKIRHRRHARSIAYQIYERTG